MKVRLDQEYWIVREGEQLSFMPAIVAQSGNKALSVPAILPDFPVIILRAGTYIEIEQVNA